MTVLSVILCAMILAVLVTRALWILRAERHAPRGTAPGRGTSLIRAEYFSGVGGGEATEYHVPKDPQAYARLFVPNQKGPGR